MARQFRQLPPASTPDDPRKVSLDITARQKFDIPPPRDSSDSGGDEIPGLLEYARILGRRKAVLAAFIVAGGLAATLYTLPQVPIYQAQTTIEIQSINTDFLNIRQVNPVSDNGDSYMYSDVQTQMKILQSDALVNSVVAKVKSKTFDNQQETASANSLWRKLLKLQDKSPAELQQQAIGTAAGSIRIRSVGQTRILEISADSTNPRVAADFINTLVSEFIDQNMEARGQAIQKTSQWLTRQLEEMRVKLERSEDQLQAYARTSGLMFTADKNTVSEERLRQYQQALSATQADRATKQARYEMAKNNPPESLPDILNDESLRASQTKMADLRRQLAELTLTLKPAHPRVQKLKLQLTEVETTAENERKAILKRIKNEYDEALTKEKLLAADYTAQTKQVTQESEKSVHYGILKREVDSNRQVYDAVLQRVKEATLISAMKASNVRVIDAAVPPGAPYKPNLQRSATMGLFGGLLIGVLFVLIAERANRSLKEPGDAPFYLNTHELGVIPAQRSVESIAKLAKLNGAARGILAKGHDGAKVEMATLQKEYSVLAESFRVTLTSILFAGHNGTRPRSLVVTSAAPGEGKSTVVSNLAIALAEINQRVLLIDADTRRPRIHTIFDLPNDRGLVTLLRENKPLTECDLAGLVQQTRISNLYALTAGPFMAGSTNLLYSDYLGEILEWFESAFDMVLIDTPPMLQMPEARVIGRLVSAVVLVLRSGQTTRDAAQAALQRLHEDGTLVLGTILNDWNPKSSTNGYYGYGRGVYGKYYEKDEESS